VSAGNTPIKGIHAYKDLNLQPPKPKISEFHQQIKDRSIFAMGDLRSYMPPGIDILPFKVKEKPK